MKIYKYIEIHVEKYLFEIIKEYIKNTKSTTLFKISSSLS